MSHSTHYRSFRRRFYGSHDPITNSVIALKDDGEHRRKLILEFTPMLAPHFLDHGARLSLSSPLFAQLFPHCSLPRRKGWKGRGGQERAGKERRGGREGQGRGGRGRKEKGKEGREEGKECPHPLFGSSLRP